MIIAAAYVRTSCVKVSLPHSPVGAPGCMSQVNSRAAAAVELVALQSAFSLLATGGVGEAHESELGFLFAGFLRFHRRRCTGRHRHSDNSMN